jgi:hypothetical protein
VLFNEGDTVRVRVPQRCRRKFDSATIVGSSAMVGLSGAHITVFIWILANACSTYVVVKHLGLGKAKLRLVNEC